MSQFIAYLKMSRVSNLPTVWGNCLLAMTAIGNFTWSHFAMVSAICSLFYVAGMILNDVCDSEIDRKERPQRPIPSGIVKRHTALLVATLILLSAIFIYEFIYAYPSLWQTLAPLALAAVIVLYDVWHKGNNFSPFIMAACRFMVYIVAALSIASYPTQNIIVMAAVAASYIVGLTYMAMQENLYKVKNYWPALFLALPFLYAAIHQAQIIYIVIAFLWVLYNIFLLYNKRIKNAIGGLIAGICFVDAMLLSTVSSTESLPYFFVLFVCTFFAQKFIPGT
ncbi:UbiA family prenyltransferase [Candidatus Uabimicrobium amorphum]|uniref:Prenyltransferase UbiA n=1 Tax=Uabimicrobium amorphum TaxID=2596890 RepID=A0A5S9IKY8_UABAM|nr:UbiA family prenyltransferase [Candidatus Uabimicrobium amorphum]BBM83272.1 prenyltransferase UbiA [Candidatus Uabimicrobium amorphum]